MSFQSVLQEIGEENRAIVMANTWGHLAPKPREFYKCQLLFTHSETGLVEAIKSVFIGQDGEELNGSPWLMSDVDDFMHHFVDKRKHTEGGVFLFNGYYLKYKNGACRFSGKTKRVRISLRHQPRRTCGITF